MTRLDPSTYDYLFVLVADGRQWYIPAPRIEGGRGLTLGGPKYAEFEVERGDPIPDTLAAPTPSTIGVRIARGDVRAAKGGGL